MHGVDPGLACLAMLAKFFDKPADYDQLRHAQCDPTVPAGEVDLLRHAKAIGFKASAVSSAWARLARTPLPCVVRHRDGGWFILAKVAADENGGGKCLIQDPRVGRPEELTRAELEERWDGRLILVATRAQLAAMGSTLTRPGSSRRW